MLWSLVYLIKLTANKVNGELVSSAKCLGKSKKADFYQRSGPSGIVSTSPLPLPCPALRGELKAAAERAWPAISEEYKVK